MIQDQLNNRPEDRLRLPVVTKTYTAENARNHSITGSSLGGRNQKKYFFTIVFTAYFALTLIRYLWPQNLILTATITFLGLLSLIVLSMKIPKDNLPIYIFTLLLAAAFLVSSIFVLRTDRIAHVLLFIFFNFGIALILVRGQVYSQGPYLVFYALASYMALLIISGADPNEALKVVSRNGISEIMIAACVCLYIIQENEGKKIDLKPAFFTFLISIWGVGRSGIVSSLVLFLGLFFVRMRLKNLYTYAAFFALLAAFLFFDQLLLLGIDNSFIGPAIDHNFARRQDDRPEARIAIWANYFNNLDFFRVFFGANVHTDPWPGGELYAFNYHNMFIHLHLQTGLMAIVVLIFILAALVKFWRSNKVFFFLLLAICMRGITDTFLFFESWDFILYFFIYYFLKNSYLSIMCVQWWPGSNGKLRSRNKLGTPAL
jgi:hypothetical protein